MPMRRETVAAALRYLGNQRENVRQRLERATSLDPQEQDLTDIAVETGASLIPGVGPALAARDFERARRADDKAGMAMAAASAIPGERLAKLLGKFDPTRLELDVYHGTPHRYAPTENNPLGEFDASKIGTGEGAQSYGHGVYYAENPEVAKGYQPRDRKAEAKLMNLYKQAESRQNYDAMEVLEAAMLHRTNDELREQFPRQKGLVNRIGKINEKAAGSLYKADLPDEMIDRMLDWDKPIKDQPTVLKSIRATLPDDVQKDFDANVQGGISGGNAYLNWVWGAKSAAQKSEKLKEAGIPGIKYADAGSRGQGGSGTRNFVVFPGEEKKVRILERK